MQTKDGEQVLFVAEPQLAPKCDNLLYAVPDAPSDTGPSWRELLVQYNRDPGKNPLNLYPAYRLYGNDAYKALVSRFGVANTYILSAGWGIIRAEFLTPQYDITFSGQAERYKRRKTRTAYRDFPMLPGDDASPIVFFGGKDYVAHFCLLTEKCTGHRIVFYNSDTAPNAPGCDTRRFVTTTRTNWHYECARAFLNGTIQGF